jgi:hypothetical protein
MSKPQYSSDQVFHKQCIKMAAGILKQWLNHFNSTVKRTTIKLQIFTIFLTDFEENMQKLQKGLWDFMWSQNVHKISKQKVKLVRNHHRKGTFTLNDCYQVF